MFRLRSSAPRISSLSAGVIATLSTLFLAFFAQPVRAQLPTTIGWTALPSSTALLNSGACPPNNFGGDPFLFAEFCQNVIRTWNGAIADTSANRLIIWGGGHNNYYGNEIYALNLTANPITLTRLKDPTIPTNYSNSENCIDGIPPGSPNFAPNSREDYGGLAFIPGPYQMFIEGGSLGCLLGDQSENTWTISLSNLSNATQWMHMNPTLTGPLPGSSGGFTYGNVTDYDPNSGLLFLSDSASIYTYNFQTNTYTVISRPDYFVTSIYLSGAIDPVRKLFVLVGGCGGGTCGPGDGVFVADISNPTTTTKQDWTAATLADPNCAEYLSGGASSISASNPGIAYDSVANDFVGWPNEGNSVYIMTPDTVNKRLTCQKLTFANGPPNSSHANNQPNTSYGTFGRFRYFPALDVFVLINDANIPAYILRLRNGSGFTLSAAPATASVIPGGTATYTVSATALNGFTGSINLSAMGLPSGSTPSFNPTSIAPGASSTLTVATTGSTAAGNSTLTIGGTSGSLAGSATVILSVTDFTLSASPSTASVAPGGSTTYTVSAVALNGFTDSVNLSVASGLPAGAIASFNPAAIAPGASSILTISTTATTPISSQTLSITGSDGSLVRSATVSLNVAAPDFALTASPGMTSVNPGGSANFTVSAAALSGFSGTVNLSVTSGLPTGATPSFNPTSINGSGTSTLTIMTTGSTPVASSTLTITGSSGSLTHSTNVILNVSSSTSSASAISIDFVGFGTTAMGGSEVAGVVALSNWNDAAGAKSTSPLALVDQNGNPLTATVSWTSDDVWDSSIQDQAGNLRLMKGYLDNGNMDTTTLTVSGLPANANGYAVYVYAEGGANNSSNTGIYQISGAGITTTSATLTYNTNFNGIFTQATAGSPVGNYVILTIPNVSGFTLSAIPSTASTPYKRAPINGIQIVPQ